MPVDQHYPDAKLVEEFAEIFCGFPHAYGQMTLLGIEDNGKVKTKNVTQPEKLTLEQYRAHLAGEIGLGVIPLLEDNRTTWGALDIDVPKMDIAALALKIQDMNLPLSVLRSKSGGAHCYIFMTEPVSAQEIVAALTPMARMIGFENCEIFPKQINRDSVQFGNWLNMPYFGGQDSDRYLWHNGQVSDPSKALAVLKSKRITPEALGKFAHPKRASAPEEPHALPAGRNDFMFKTLLKLQGTVGDDLLLNLAQRINESATATEHPNYADGALSAYEVETIVKSVLKFGQKTPRKDNELDADQALAFMNQNHAIVRESGKTHVLSVEMDEFLNRRAIIRSSFADISNYYKARVIIGHKAGKPVHAQLGKWWTNNPDAKRFKQVIFAPRTTGPEIFNLWQGFAVEAKPGKCELFYDHLLNNICSGNQEYYAYFMNWLARLFQQPDRLGEVIIAVRGGKGVGKGVVGNTISRLIGQHAIHISNGRHLTGNFNAHLQDTLFVFVDEAFWAGDVTGESVLKTLATEPTIFIEPKGVNGFEVPNFLHMMIASNSDWVISASRDERRFFMLDVAETRQQDTEYFSALTAELEQGGYEALMNDLMNRDISGFNVRKIPQTDALADQKLQSLGPVQRVWLEFLMEGRLPEDNDGWSGVVSREGLQAAYVASLNNNGVRYKSMATMVGSQLKNLVPFKLDTKKTILKWHEESKQNQPVQVQAYQFPGLKECREFFEQKTGTKPEWPAEGSAAQDQKPVQGEIPF